MTNDERLHWLGGFIKMLPYLGVGRFQKFAVIADLDRWAFNREWEQNLAGQNPNPLLSDKQLREAKAWGKGGRWALRCWPAYPSCYTTRRPE